MQFFVVVTALLASVAQAADLCGAAGSSCSGTLRCCSGIQENICCNFGIVARTVRLTLPANSRGRAWTGTGCQGTVSEVSTSSAGTFCQNWTSRQSAKWLTGRSVVKARAPEPEASDACVDADTVITARGERLSIREAAEMGLLDEE